MSASEPWYVEAFREGYLDVYPHRDLAAARREAAYLVAQGVKGRVLDVCCGFGRHVAALRDLGVDAFGVDLSAHLLRRAERVHGRVVRGDARALPFGIGRLDAVVSLFSSFGYFGEVGDQAALAEMSRVLRTGGLLVLDLMNPERVREGLVAESRRQTEGALLIERRSLSDDGRRVIKLVEIQSRKGWKRWREEVRLYEATEFEVMFASQGLQAESWHGDFDARPPTADSPRRIVIARRSRS